MRHELIESLRFLDDNHRHKALFLLLLRSENYITSDSLAKQLDVTSRTIKSDMKFITDKLKDTDITVLSIKSKGTMIHITNEVIKNEIKEYFQIYQPSSIDNDFEQRIQYIIRRLLISNKPIRIETLQEELYLNTSNYIHKEVGSIKSFLKQYKLFIASKSKEGIMIEGCNFNKYLCMVRLYKYFDKVIFPEFKINEYSKVFIPNFATKEEIRDIICKTILKTRIVFSDIYLERFVMFFILLTNVKVSNKDMSDNIRKIDLNYLVTDEYKLVQMIETEMSKFDNYNLGNEVRTQFLTYMAITSTDLYRMKDCVEDKYDTLINLAEIIRMSIIEHFESIFKVSVSDDIIFLKDILKVLIPIAMKIKLGVSDDVDLGFYNQNAMNNKPVITFFVEEINKFLKKEFDYQLSSREKHLLFNVIYEFINNIELKHKELKIALIAIDGRISTQQLKFCIRRYFPSYIKKIDTKVLYELDEMEVYDYDCYFCMEYGKNMSIPYKPIYFFEEGLAESVYYRTLQTIFLSSYDYNLILPSIKYIKVKALYKLDGFPIDNFTFSSKNYLSLTLGNNKDINLHVCFDAENESIRIYHFGNDDIDIKGFRYYLIIDSNINYDKQKLKMLLNFINKIEETPDLLSINCSEVNTDIKSFFQ